MALTTWHITFGTYGTRLHGGERATVDRRRNQRGDPFILRNEALERSQQRLMRAAPVLLSDEQRQFIQDALPAICERGDSVLRTCAAGADHVHLLLDIDPTIHGERVRELVKRWLTQALDARWGKPASGTWWAKQGSNRAVKDSAYLANAIRYIGAQRA